MKQLVVLGVVLLACAVVGGGVASIPDDSDTRVVGGENAAREQFPGIISLIWVVTAAHCITESPGIGSFQVRAGFLLQNDPASIGQQVAVISSTVHPNYAGGVNPNDIAILNLGTLLTVSSAIQPVGLPPFQSIPTGIAALAGWGSTSTTGQQIMPNQLQHIPNKDILPHATCIEDLIFLFGTSNPLATSNVCTGGVARSACSGDSGGPLLQGDTLVGIVSWGVIPCGTFRAPSVYTNPSFFVPWIQSLL